MPKVGGKPWVIASYGAPRVGFVWTPSAQTGAGRRAPAYRCRDCGREFPKASGQIFARGGSHGLTLRSRDSCAGRVEPISRDQPAPGGLL